jgi:hypothetical protein
MTAASLRIEGVEEVVSLVEEEVSQPWLDV